MTCRRHRSVDGTMTTTMPTTSNDFPANRTVTRAKAMAILEQRRGGMWVCEDLLNEAILSLWQLKQKPTDKVYTLRKADGKFNVFDTHEMLEEVQKWKRLGVKLYKQNIYHDRDFKEMGTASIFIITPPGRITHCPLGLTLGVMCDGHTYVTLDKSLIEVVWRALGSHEFKD